MDVIADRITKLSEELVKLDNKNKKLTVKASIARQNVAQVQSQLELFCAKITKRKNDQDPTAAHRARITTDLSKVCCKTLHDLDENKKERAEAVQLLKNYIVLQNTLKETLDENEILPPLVKKRKIRENTQKLLITEEGGVTIPLGLPKEHELLVVTIVTNKTGKHVSAAVRTTTDGNLKIAKLHTNSRYKFVVRMLDGSKSVYVARRGNRDNKDGSV